MSTSTSVDSNTSLCDLSALFPQKDDDLSPSSHPRARDDRVFSVKKSEDQLVGVPGVGLLPAVVYKALKDAYKLNKSTTADKERFIIFANKESESVCIKVIYGTSKTLLTDRKDLSREYNSLKAVGPPLVLKAVKLIEQKEFTALVTELMDDDLYTVSDEAVQQKEGLFSEEGMKAVFRTLVSAVKALHDDFDTCHLDIKPENFLVKFPQGHHPSGRQWLAKDYFDAEHHSKFRSVLGDLAFAMPLRDKETNQLFYYVGFLGTPGYIAPEVEAGSNFQGDLADVYSIARTLFLIAVGFPPWEQAHICDPFYASFRGGQHDEFWEAMKFHCSQFEITEGFIDFITPMMCFEPDRRPTCADILEHPFLLP